MAEQFTVITTPIGELSANELAYRAECGSPDAPDSAGALFLKSVRDSVAEAIDYGRLEDRVDLAHEVADGAPSAYTYQMWAEFVDLAAYQEDPSELGADAGDMEHAARVCLYIIAERLARALLTEYTGEEEDA